MESMASERTCRGDGVLWRKSIAQQKHAIAAARCRRHRARRCRVTGARKEERRPSYAVAPSVSSEATAARGAGQTPGRHRSERESYLEPLRRQPRTWPRRTRGRSRPTSRNRRPHERPQRLRRQRLAQHGPLARRDEIRLPCNERPKHVRAARRPRRMRPQDIQRRRVFIRQLRGILQPHGRVHLVLLDAEGLGRRRSRCRPSPDRTNKTSSIFYNFLRPDDDGLHRFYFW